MTQPSFGIALGGGSARGYTHIGVLKTLEKHGVTPDVLAGASAGAMIGGLYASGWSTQDLETYATTQRRRDILSSLADFGLDKAALFAGDKLEGFMQYLIGGGTFADLDKPFIVGATDADTGERVVLRKGSVARALRASMSMPGIFAPTEVSGRLLLDGGLAFPQPVDMLLDEGVDIALGVGVGTLRDGSPSIRLTERVLDTRLGKGVFERVQSSKGETYLHTLGRALTHTAASWRDGFTVNEEALHLQIDPGVSWLEFNRAEEAIAAGEEAMEAFMPTLLEAFEVTDLMETT